MKRIIVHIGQAKTGTTTLQGSLFASRDALLKHGVLYPRTIRGNNHRLAKAYFDGPEAAHKLERRLHAGDNGAIVEEATRAWNLIRDDIAKHKPATTILSSESFFSMAMNKGFSDFFELLTDMAEEVTFVAYLRAPSALYLSLYQQNLKVFGDRATLEKHAYYEPPLKHYLQTKHINLKVHKFDRAHLARGDIVADFTSRYLSADAASAVCPPDATANASISAEAMKIFEEIHKGTAPSGYGHLGPFTQSMSKRIRATDSKVPGKSSPRYKPGIARIVHDCSTDLDWVKKSFGIKFDVPEAHPDAVDISIDDLNGVSDFCVLDQDRYVALWRELAENSKNRKASAVARPTPSPNKSAGLINPLRSVRRTFRRVTKPIRQSKIARAIRASMRPRS